MYANVLTVLERFCSGCYACHLHLYAPFDQGSVVFVFTAIVLSNVSTSINARALSSRCKNNSRRRKSAGTWRFKNRLLYIGRQGWCFSTQTKM